MTPQEPRPAGAGSLSAPLAIGLFLFSPVVLACWLLGQALLRVTGWRWWKVALGALVLLGLVVIVRGGPTAALRTHFSWFQLHGRQLLAGGRVHLVPTAALWPQLPLAVPIGFLAASLNLARIPQRALMPAGEQRIRRQEARHERTATRLAEKATTTTPRRLPAPPLAVSISGDLDTWRYGRFIIPPADILGLARAYIGVPGFGKTVGLAREVYLAAYAGRRVIVFDGKGSDRTLAATLIAAYLAGWAAAGRSGEPRIGLFPEQPMDVWRGGPKAVANRFMACWAFPGIAEYYGENAQLALRLALEAPGVAEVRNSRELAHRIMPGILRGLWEDDPDGLHLVKSLDDTLPGVGVRLGNLLAALAGQLDGGWSFEDVDLGIVTVPTMIAPKDADAILRILLVDYGHYILVRKKPGEEDILLFDEFSAILGGRQGAINIVERARGSGSGVILAGQSRRSLGTDEEADRILHACSGGVSLFRSAEPEDVIRLAGTLHVPELVHQVENGRLTGRASATVRAQHRLDANTIRSFSPGEAAIIEGGRAERVRYIRTRYPEAIAARARALVREARLGLPAADQKEPGAGVLWQQQRARLNGGGDDRRATLYRQGV